MYRYILKRLGLAVFVLIGVSMLVYCLMELSPVDSVISVVGEDATEEEYRQEWLNQHLDKPVIWRYFNYMGKLLQGDLGYSKTFKEDVWVLFKNRFPTTIALTLSATIVATLISLPLAIISAVKRGSVLDNICSVLAVVGLAAPNFWVGLMLMLLFALKLGWFNSMGFHSWKDMVLPAITVGTGHTANVVRHTRSALVDVLNKDYLQLARAKGLSERKVVLKHALGNALIPFIQVTGTQIAGSLGGSVLTETVFSLPGVGLVMNQALKSNDPTTVMGCMILHSMIVSLTLLILDLIYAAVDPRIKANYTK
ncbi:MAG: ABC transporter permease [Spirochaetales bacterium]|nr:ABC transporter permease [Spirochaetales bacterium]